MCQEHLTGSSRSEWGASVRDLWRIKDDFLEEIMLELNFDVWTWGATKHRGLGCIQIWHKVGGTLSKVADLIFESMSLYTYVDTIEAQLSRFNYLNPWPNTHWTSNMVHRHDRSAAPQHSLSCSQWWSNYRSCCTDPGRLVCTPLHHMPGTFMQ